MRLHKIFSKKRIKSIYGVEYTVNGNTIRTSSQLEMEEVVIAKNLNRFKLAYDSLIFKANILTKIGMRG